MRRESLMSFLGTVAMLARAATGSAQESLPPVRPIGPIEHVSGMALKSAASVRELTGRRVLVNDIVDHRVLLFDSTFVGVSVIADSTASTANAYGNRPGGLIPYQGDSTLFVDPASLSMLVLDANAQVARVMAVPRPNEAAFLIGGPFGDPGFDRLGHLVYRGAENRPLGAPAGVDLKTYVPQFPDSAPIVRLNVANRAEDTVAFFKLPPTKLSVTRTDNGFTATSIVNPLPIVDNWVLLPNGTVAVVRGRDFHIDWYQPDGTHSSSDKVPFEWQRLTDSLKAFVLDSAKQVMEKQREERMAILDSTRKLTGVKGQQMIAPGDQGAGGAGGGNVVVMMRVGGGDGGAAPPRRGATSMPTIPPLTFVQPHELPDYRPAFGAGATKCDAQGNLWIRTSEAKDGRPVYDVVNDKGTLVDRVQLPPFRTIAGFAPGVVYLAVTDAAGAVHLERARLK